MMQVDAERAIQTLIEQVLLASALVTDVGTQALLREAVYAAATAQRPQLRLRLSLLASVIVESFRHAPAIAMGLLEDVDQVRAC